MGILCIVMILSVNKGEKLPGYSSEELVGEYYSPTNSRKVYIYQGPTKESIMVDDFVVGELKCETGESMGENIIYYKSHEQFISCYWKDEDNVVINGQIVNVTDKKTWVYEE